MSPHTFRLNCFRRGSAFLNQAGTKTNQRIIALITTLLLTMPSLAQQPVPSPPPVSPDNSTAASIANTATASIPAGTRIALVLTQPIQTRYVHRGDDIYAQTVSPVTSATEVVIPPGTFVQGKIDKLERQGGRAELRLQSLAITFPDGYVAPVSGPITLESDDGYTFKDPGKGRIVGAISAPLAGVGLGALIGHAAGSSNGVLTNTLPPGCTGPPPNCLTSSVPEVGTGAKNTLIGAAVGGLAGGLVSIALLLTSHDFYMDAGSPVSMVLHQPVVLPEDEVEAAIRDAEEHPAPEPPVPEPSIPTPPTPDNDPGTWYTPGTPGTPDIDIPGTPPVGGSPGTPPIHIPGTPPTPPTPHPCP